METLGQCSICLEALDGGEVALACGHNAPWRRKERDALYAWLEVQLPPSS